MFNFIKQELISVDLINNTDVQHLAIYADSYDKYIKMNEIVTQDGFLIDGSAHPLLVKMEKQASQMRLFGAELGLNPSSRSKLAIHMQEEKSEDEWDY